jgi:putative flippase GtrA
VRKPLPQRFLKFLLVGGSCTLLDFTLFYVFYYHVALGIVPTNLISYGTGLTVAFFVNRAWTFKDSQARAANRLWLSLFWGYLGLALNTLMVWGLAKWMHPLVSKAIAVIVVLVYNYLTNKYLVFRITDADT